MLAVPSDKGFYSNSRYLCVRNICVLFIIIGRMSEHKELE